MPEGRATGPGLPSGSAHEVRGDLAAPGGGEPLPSPRRRLSPVGGRSESGGQQRACRLSRARCGGTHLCLCTPVLPGILVVVEAVPPTCSPPRSLGHSSLSSPGLSPPLSSVSSPLLLYSLFLLFFLVPFPLLSGHPLCHAAFLCQP